MARNGKTVEFRIRAKDEASAVLKQVEKNLKGLSGAEYVKRSATELAKMREELRKLEAQTRSAQTNIGKVAVSNPAGIEKAKREYQQLKVAVDSVAASITKLETSRTSARSGILSGRRDAAEKEATELLAAAKTRQQAAEKAAAIELAAQKKFDEARAKNQRSAYTQVWRDLLDERDVAEKEAAELLAAAKTRQDAAEKAAAIELAADKKFQADLTKGRHVAYTQLWNDLLDQRDAAQQAAVAYDQLGNAVDRTTAKLTKQAAANRNTGALSSLSRKSGILEREVAAISTSQGRGFLGLRPYELTNLSYQVNDLVTGVAMGQPPMQVFMQQIGQISQLFPSAVTGVLKFAASIKGAFVVALGIGVARAKTLSDTLADLDKTLSLNADSSRYNLTGLAEMVDKYDQLGMSVKDARDAVKLFIKEGVEQSKISGLMNLSLGYSKVTGTKQSEATETIVKAFTGGVEKVRELDKELNFLTASQYQHILSLKEVGKESEAVGEAQRILQAKLDEITNKSSGPWSRAFRSLGDAFNRLATAMSNSAFLRILGNGFNFLAKQIEQGAKDLDKFIKLLERIKNNGTELLTGEAKGSNAEKILRNNEKIATQQARLDSARRSDPLGQSELYTNEIAEAQAEIQRLTEENLTLFGEMNAEMQTSADISEEQVKLNADINEAIDARLATTLKEAEWEEKGQKWAFIRKGLEQEIVEARKEGVELWKDQLRLQEIASKYAGIYDTQRSAEFTNGSAIGSFVDKVVGVESGGNRLAKNPNSTATGLGQFIESTWLSMFKKYFPDRAESMTDAAILALREDAEISRKMIELYAKENAEVIKSLGQNVTEGKLYLAHFLGAGGAKSLLGADPKTAVSELLPQSTISANRSILEGKSAGEVIAWAERKMGVSKQELEITTALGEKDAERVETAKDLATGTQERIEAEKEGVRLAGMRERAAYAEKIVQDEINKYAKEGLTLDNERVEALRQAALAKWDAENADRVAMENYERLLDIRGSLMTSFSAAQESGDETQMASVAAQIADVDTQLQAAAQSAIAFWQSVGGPEADANIAKINATIASLDKVEASLIDAKDANRQLSQVGSDAMNAFSQAVANGENAAEAFYNALRQGIAQFIIDLTSAIAKQMIFNAISGGGGGTGGAGGWISNVSSWFTQNHQGGLAGQGQARRIDPAVFAEAVRYHTGGIAGLKPNEVPAILKRGEEVLTENDPRHVGNGGASSVNIKQVNVLDPAEIVGRALADEEGQRVMINWMSRNRNRVSGALG